MTFSRKNFRVNEFYDLPVKEIRREYHRTYYVVEADGKEYAIGLYPCQIDDPRPESLRCLVRSVENGEPQFVQDIAPLLFRYYEVDKSYPFTVIRDETRLTPSRYVVMDRNGLQFWLCDYRHKKLFSRQEVTCRVVELYSNHLRLSLEDDSESRRGMPFVSWDELPDYGLPSDFCETLRSSYAGDARFQGIQLMLSRREPRWVMAFLQLIDGTTSQWLSEEIGENHLRLAAVRRFCLTLLEETDFLQGCEEGERVRYQTLLSTVVGRMDAYLRAEELIERGEQENYIRDLLGKLRRAGYLYDPDRALQQLMSLFFLDRNLLQSQMQALFQTIIEGNHAHWTAEPFRSAFVKMLELYIEENSLSLDKTLTVESPEKQEELSKMIMALGIQQLLSRVGDPYDRNLRKAMLYRYATLLNEDLTASLLDKALATLIKVEPETLEYNWSDLSQEQLLAAKLSCKPIILTERVVTQSEGYEGETAELTLRNGRIELSPIDDGHRLKPALPPDLLPWREMQVYLPEEPKTRVRSTDQNLLHFQQLWTEVERGLFQPAQPVYKAQARKLSPSVGDEVMIRVSHPTSDPGVFWCEVEDERYEGGGTLSGNDIYRYPIKNATMDLFRNESGEPLLFLAKVDGVTPEGKLIFSLQEMIYRFIKENVDVGDTVICKVIDRRQTGFYLTVSEYGYNVYIPKEKDAPLGDNPYEVRITQVMTNGTCKGEVIQEILERLDIGEAVSSLLASFASGVYVPEATEIPKDRQLSRLDLTTDEMRELINIIDRKAVSCENIVDTYNYLGMARLMAGLIEDQDLRAYYVERQRLLQLLNQFAINGKIDEQAIEEMDAHSESTFCASALLQNRRQQLRIICCLDKPHRNADLWRWSEETTDPVTRELCRVVLASNLIGSRMNREDKAPFIKTINDLLHVEIKPRETFCYGTENQRLEFKSSLLYPADNHMRRDIPKQTMVILRVLCGFLNAQGGRLLIGVNDQGMAIGIAEELNVFGSEDKLDLYLRAQIKEHLGMRANNLCQGQFLRDDEEFTVYEITVQPSDQLVRLADKAYLRQGTSTWEIPKEEEPQYERSEGQPDQPEETVQIESKDVYETKPVVDEIRTSMHRNNVSEEWENDFDQGAIGYLHFLPKGTYMVTSEPSHRSNICLTLVIHESERDGYLVLVYQSGNTLKVPVSFLLDRTPETIYKRFTEEPLFFASILHKEDALLTRTRDRRNDAYRLDMLSAIREGNLSQGGWPLIVTDFGELVQVDQVPKFVHSDLKRITNLRNTNPGFNMGNVYDQLEVMALKKVGIEV